MSGKYVPPYLRHQQTAGNAGVGTSAPAAAAGAASPAVAGRASPSLRPAAAAASPSSLYGATASPLGGGATAAAVAPRSPAISLQGEQQQQQQQPLRRRGLDALPSETAAVAPETAEGGGDAALRHPSHGVGAAEEATPVSSGDMMKPSPPSMGSPSPAAGTSQQQQHERNVSAAAAASSPPPQQQPGAPGSSSGGGGSGVTSQQGQQQQQQPHNRWSQVLMGHSGSGTGAARGGRQYNRGAGAVAGGGARMVEVDGLVLLKVLKHCRENFPTPVNGQLLGVDSKDKLEVTNCFPLPQKKDMMGQLQRNGDASRAGGGGDREIEERLDEEFDKYQDKMAELMHDVNVDCFTVGWYQTLSFGDLKGKHIIDSLVLYQEEVQRAIVLGVDPTRTGGGGGGKAAFKAYRVHPDFLQKYQECEQDVAKYNRLRAKDILIEVSIVVVNPFLVEAFLMDWASQDPLLGVSDMEALEVDQSNYLERNLLQLSTALETLGDEQERLQRYQREYLKQQQLQKHLLERRRLENEQRRLRGEAVLPVEMEGPAFRKIDPPSQLHTLLMSHQAQLQCEEINLSCCETLSKMFLLHWANNRKRNAGAAPPASAAAGALPPAAGGAGGGGAGGGGPVGSSSAALRV